jgi:DNA-directed RNA polymerase subunit RPC12/RpoP
MVIWKNIKCPSCGKPNDRDELKARKGVCIYCGFHIVSNLMTFQGLKKEIPITI